MCSLVLTVALNQHKFHQLLVINNSSRGTALECCCKCERNLLRSNGSFFLGVFFDSGLIAQGNFRWGRTLSDDGAKVQSEGYCGCQKLPKKNFFLSKGEPAFSDE